MRRQQVLEAARRCFARDGFHATTMADVVRESALSAGAVYRYFPSKASLVLASAHGATGRADEILIAMAAQDRAIAPHEVLRAVLTHLVEVSGQDQALLRLAVSGWSEALRDESLMGDLSTLHSDLRAGLGTLAARWVDAGHLASGTDAEAIAQLMLGAVTGFMLQRLVLGVDVDRYCQAFAALSGTAIGDLALQP